MRLMCSQTQRFVASSSSGFRALVFLNLQRGWRDPFVATGFGGLAEDLADQGPADSVGTGDLAQTASGPAVADDSAAINVQWPAADMAAMSRAGKMDSTTS